MLSALFMFRYGDSWAPWRRCSYFDGGKINMLRLSSNEWINRLSGHSQDTNSLTLSLRATTTTGRTWGPHGDHTPVVGLSSLRSSPDADNLTLRFISGDQTTNKYILRWLSSF